MADPLSQLRQFHINRREIKEHNDYIIFGDHGWPKSVHTNYQIYSSADDSNKKDYYTLECLLYFLKNKQLAHHLYVRQAGREEIPVVHRPDRKSLLAFLEGEVQTAPAIDKNAPIPSVRLPVSEIYKRSSNQNSSQYSGTEHGSGGAGSQYGQNELHRGISDDFSSPTLRGQKRPHDPEMEKKYREEFAARLYEQPVKKSVTIIPSDSANRGGESAEGSAAISKFGAEKLAALRAKHMAVKRTTIIDADELGKPTSGAADLAGKEDLLISMDAEKFKLIKSKEKVWRTRSTILQSQTKDFAKSILPMLDLLAKNEGTSRKPAGNMPPVPTDIQMNSAYQNPNSSSITNGPNPHHPQQASSQRNTYNRYDQERFVKLDIGVDINTKGSFFSANGLTSMSQPTAQPLSAVTKTPVQSRVGPPPNATTPNNGQHQHRSSSQQKPPSSRPTKRHSTVPIIIIPATVTSLINMYNASTILEDLTYAEGKPGAKSRESEIMIQRKKSDGTHAFYKIIDNPLKLDADDWNRVVAVFVQGPSWQFKGWPWGGSPVEIFSRIKAFHLKWDEQKLDDNVAKWNVHILELSRSKRHLDRANLLIFWSTLDTFMTKYKSFLKF